MQIQKIQIIKDSKQILLKTEKKSQFLETVKNNVLKRKTMNSIERKFAGTIDITGYERTVKMFVMDYIREGFFSRKQCI